VLPKKEFPPDIPISREGTTTCYTCHLFHASDFPKLSRGLKEQCGLGCHEAQTPKATEPGSEGVAEERAE
jgi:predicted CXXCH cytochrome family protein